MHHVVIMCSNAIISRRQFLRTGSLIGIATGVGIKSLPSWAEKFPSGRPLEEFSYSDVSISSEVHESQLRNTHSVLIALSEDSLVKPFRQMSGMAAPGEDLAVGTRTIPITTIARVSIRVSRRAATSDNGCRHWHAPMPLPEKRKLAKRCYG